jgi:hypothetical protein
MARRREKKEEEEKKSLLKPNRLSCIHVAPLEKARQDTYNTFIEGSV